MPSSTYECSLSASSIDVPAAHESQATMLRIRNIRLLNLPRFALLQVLLNQMSIYFQLSLHAASCSQSSLSYC